MVAALKAKSKKEQVQEIYKVHPNFNRSEAADVMGVSRQTINTWIKDTNQGTTLKNKNNTRE
jgi:transposase